MNSGLEGGWEIVHGYHTGEFRAVPFSGQENIVAFLTPFVAFDSTDGSLQRGNELLHLHEKAPLLNRLPHEALFPGK